MVRLLATPRIIIKIYTSSANRNCFSGSPLHSPKGSFSGVQARVHIQRACVGVTFATKFAHKFIGSASGSGRGCRGGGCGRFLTEEHLVAG